MRLSIYRLCLIKDGDKQPYGVCYTNMEKFYSVYEL